MIEKEIKEIIALILEDEGITSKNVSENQSLIEDLGFDSVRLMVLATEVESKFDIVMDEGKLENINTVSDVIRHVPAVTLPSNIIDRKIRLFSNYNSQIAVLASKLAIEDSGIAIPETNEIPVILGQGIGDLGSSFKNFENHISGKRMDRFAAPKIMSNAPSAWISIVNKLYGENQIVNAACASSTNAVGESFRKIADGYASIVICGGTECLQDNKFTTMKILEGLGVFDNSKNGQPKPFHHSRSGMLMNEGAACCLVLEEYEHAKSRKAHIYAEITGFESAMDAHSIVAIDESGLIIEKMLRKLIGENNVDYYNAHGTGTVLNDKVESTVFKKIFGENIKKQPIINSTKGNIRPHVWGKWGNRSDDLRTIH